ncbi:hypothetical protein [Gilvimarinus xylanilyticus]|uniref:Uncharacterized protein n=1 Tax=Gilvimarinus xylanilyticus TaxID=2944139 RepID=A0A9X2I5Z7_9GAMM|nr:hypothetical protein [Gilvimarinus xylanilyticus]MCP8900067.1 hypothetical protein [Gilvimarinus xylanilyticus]
MKGFNIIFSCSIFFFLGFFLKYSGDEKRFHGEGSCHKENEKIIYLQNHVASLEHKYGKGKDRSSEKIIVEGTSTSEKISESLEVDWSKDTKTIKKVVAVKKSPIAEEEIIKSAARGLYIKDRLLSGKQSPTFDNVASDFENQNIGDRVKATEKNQEIIDLFLEDESLYNISLSEVECKIRSCRLRLYSGDHNTIYQKLSSALVSSVKSEFVMVPNFEAGEVEVYIGRDGQSLINLTDD